MSTEAIANAHKPELIKVGDYIKDSRNLKMLCRHSLFALELKTDYRYALL